MLPKESVQKMKSYQPPLEGREDYLRLDFNENTRGPSPQVLAALKNISLEECSCYPDYRDFKETLSQFLGVEEGMVLPTNGSDEAIKLVFDTYIEKGDGVILLSPSYALFEIYAQIAGANISFVSYRLPDFSFPIEEVLKAIQPSTRLLIVASPNNPTGTLIPREDLRKILEKNPNMIVLLDEAYVCFAKETHLDLVREYPNILVTQTFSKGFGLAGLRIGYLIASQSNIAVLSQVLSPYSVNRLAIVAATAAIEDASYLKAYVEEVIEAREEFRKEMNQLRFQTFPSQGNFVLVKFGELTEALKKALAREKILVRGRSEDILKGFVRITIGTKEQMKRLLNCLKKPALIFDMDGVLVDESESYRQCIQKTATDLSGKEIARSVVEEFKNRGGLNNDYDCVQAIVLEQGIQVDLEQLIEKFDQYYEIFKEKEKWLIDEAFLSQMKEKFRLGIFTGRPKKDALDALKRFKKESFFEVVITDDDVKKRKPDPEGIFLACRGLGVTKAIYVGDTQDDREAARLAGIDFLDVKEMLCLKEK